MNIGQLLLAASVVAGGVGFGGGYLTHAIKDSEHGYRHSPGFMTSFAGSSDTGSSNRFEIHIDGDFSGLESFGRRIENIVERHARHGHGRQATQSCGNRDRPRLGVELRSRPMVEDQVETIEEDDRIIERRVKGRRAPQVVGIDEDAPAYQAGIREGDFLVEIAGGKVSSTKGVLRQIRSQCSQKPLAVTVFRDGNYMRMSVPPRAG